MIMRKNFKESQVGLIPEDWDVKKLGELASLTTGPFGSSIHKADYITDGIPFINPIHISNGELFPDRNITLSSETVERLSIFKLRTNDIILGRRGEMGRCAVIKENQQGWLCGSGSLIIRPNSKIVPEFLRRIISSPSVIAKIEETSVGSTMINLNQAVLFGLWILYPPLPEQHLIATAINDVEAFLIALDELIAKKRLIKQGAMQELLTGKKRVLDFDNEWKYSKMASFIANKKYAIVDGPFGSQLKVNEYVTKGVPVIEMEHLHDGIINPELERCITEQKFEVIKRSAVYPNDIVISKTGSLGYLGIVPKSVRKAMITSRLAKISLDHQRANLFFVFQWLLKLKRDGYWEKVSQGGTMQILSLYMLENAPIPDISFSEQTAIAEILSDMDAEISALEARREKTRLLKQGMMQELLTGRIRLV
jgi:type I restriction enzyme S subunit